MLCIGFENLTKSRTNWYSFFLGRNAIDLQNAVISANFPISFCREFIAIGSCIWSKHCIGDFLLLYCYNNTSFPGLFNKLRLKDRMYTYASEPSNFEPSSMPRAVNRIFRIRSKQICEESEHILTSILWKKLNSACHRSPKPRSLSAAALSARFFIFKNLKPSG